MDSRTVGFCKNGKDMKSGKLMHLFFGVSLWLALGTFFSFSFLNASLCVCCVFLVQLFTTCQIVYTQRSLCTSEVTAFP